MRHSKAAWPDDTADFDRPLAKRGQRDAAAAGQWLQSQGWLPDLALVSSAARTRETYGLVAAELPGAAEPTLTDEIYHGGMGDLLDTVRGIDDEVECALLVGHNPSVAMLCRLLDDESTAVAARSRMRSAFPTSAIGVFEMDEEWAAANPGTARLIAFHVPRA
jgi:phosphohistidine phosphatase